MHDESLTDTGSDWFHTFLALLPVRWSSPPTFSDTFVNVLAQNAINKHAACLMYLLLESQIFVLLSWTYPGLGIRLHLYPNYVGNLWQTDFVNNHRVLWDEDEIWWEWQRVYQSVPCRHWQDDWHHRWAAVGTVGALKHRNVTCVSFYAWKT